MKKALSLAALALLFLATPATAAPTHREEIDGCDHGATGKECRPDPSPNGKDCQAHGNHGGINEDHCEEESSPTTTTTSGPPATTTTSVPSAERLTTTTTTEPLSSSTPTVHETGSTSSLPGPSDTPLTVTPSTTSHGMAELPATGSGTSTLLVIGSVLLLAGVALLRL